ncbi:MAG TPA: hypothetical protein DD435_14365 [Cyanobacteria bacterium UBA8530]|nr:hypothetical protein [Cyanobacteria bacterium UBA8530]
MVKEKKFAIALSSAFLLAAAPPSGFSFERGPVSRRTYPVHAESFATALRQCREKGPRLGNMRYPGQTTYSFRYRYAFRGETSELSELSIKWDQSTFLPRLDESRLSPGDRRAWHRWLGNLEKHEEKHLEISSDPGIERDFKRLFLRCRASSNKKKIEEEIIKGVGDIKKGIDRANSEWDRRTDHGLKP